MQAKDIYTIHRELEELRIQEKMQLSFEEYLSEQYTLKPISRNTNRIFAPTYFSDRKMFSVAKPSKSMVIRNEKDREILLTYIHTISHHTRATRHRIYTDTYYDSYPVFSLKTAFDFGRSLIRTEKMIDKILELITRIEVEFPAYPKFSSKYFCLSSDPQIFQEAISPEFTSCLLGYRKNIFVEFSNKTCIIHNPYNVHNPLRHSTITQLAFSLQEIIGK